MNGKQIVAQAGITHPTGPRPLPLQAPAQILRGFSRVVAAEPKKPALVVPLEPHAFADTWKDKPTTTERIGIRSISEKTYIDARASAARSAWALHPEENEEDDRIAAYNDSLMAVCVGEACTAADSIDEPYFGTMAEDKARISLTSEGLRTLFGALEQHIVGGSPIAPQATDEDISRLAEIAPAALRSMSEGRSRRLRRLLAHVLAELG